VIVGTLQPEFAEHRLKGLGAALHVAGRLTARARPIGAGEVGVVSIQPLLDDPCRKAQSLPPHGRFQRLEVQRLGSLPT
jgi:hypothetical protein